MFNTFKTKYGRVGISTEGYLRISSEKEGNFKKLLHRVVFEDYYNIDLDIEFPNGIIIHHLDGNKLNNEIWNLVPMTREDHASFHHSNSKNPNYKDYPRIIKNGHYKGEQVYAIRHNGKRIMRSVDLDKLQKMLKELESY